MWLCFFYCCFCFVRDAYDVFVCCPVMLFRALLIASASCGVSGISLIGLLGVLLPHLEHVMLSSLLVVIRMLLQCWHFTIVFV
jgi:hypothetical protein